MSEQSYNKSTLLSLADISRHFNLPESTTRYYCKRFAAYLPIHGEGRRRRYGAESINIISTVLEYMKAGKNASAVEKELDTMYARAADVCVPAIKAQNDIQSGYNYENVDSNLAMRLLEQQSNAMQSIAESLSVLANQQQYIQDLTAAAKDATEENIQLRNEVIRLKTVIRSAEAVHQDDLDQVRTWMNRLATSYNNKTQLDTQLPQEKKN